MKEKDRQLIVERIQKDIEERKLLQEKYNKLQNLLMDKSRSILLLYYTNAYILFLPVLFQELFL